MTIHHSQIKKAEKLGFTLTEKDDLVDAFWPKRALTITGTSPGDAIAQMQAAIAIMSDDTMRIVRDTAHARLVDVVHSDGTVLVGGPMPPVAAHKAIFIDKNAKWENPDESEIVDDTPGNIGGYDGPFGASDASATASETAPIVKRINGVAIDGKIAYSEGTPAGDCPYSSEAEDEEEYANFERWNEEWDAAADEASEEEGEKGSVVAEKYRAKYAEAGHPTHCGDQLAEIMNEICLNKGGTNLELFEEICLLNGVDTSKYKRSGVGWEGRIRMTGRNLLAKRVFLNDGILILPQTLHGGVFRMSGEWMATRPYKKPAKVEVKPTGDVIAIKTK